MRPRIIRHDEPMFIEDKMLKVSLIHFRPHMFSQRLHYTTLKYGCQYYITKKAAERPIRSYAPNPAPTYNGIIVYFRKIVDISITNVL